MSAYSKADASGGNSWERLGRVAGEECLITAMCVLVIIIHAELLWYDEASWGASAALNLCCPSSFIKHTQRNAREKIVNTWSRSMSKLAEQREQSLGRVNMQFRAAGCSETLPSSSSQSTEHTCQILELTSVGEEGECSVGRQTLKPHIQSVWSGLSLST